jgi:hypothetical protein
MIKLYEEFSKKLEVITDYYENGQKKSEYWYMGKNKIHREDGPAHQTWFNNGYKEKEWWLLNDDFHRENGPANQWWYINGQKLYQSWSISGKYHREDGPAIQSWMENGQKKSESWYLKDKRYLREEWVKKLKKIKSPHYKEQKMLLDAEKYNL